MNIISDVCTPGAICSDMLFLFLACIAIGYVGTFAVVQLAKMGGGGAFAVFLPIAIAAASGGIGGAFLFAYLFIRILWFVA